MEGPCEYGIKSPCSISHGVKPTGKRPLERPRRRGEKKNIRMDLKETYFNTRNCVDLTQDMDFWRALVNVALSLRVLYAMELVKPTGNLSLGRHRRRSEKNIRMDL